jgi:glyoxylase-like metal-dependent hydrolase (beta-lactamase superfamily II)
MQSEHPTVTPIHLGMVNAFLIRGERTILVDTGIPGSADRIMAALAEHNIAPAEVSLILLTHAHEDHYGSAAELRARLGAPLAAQRLDALALREGRDTILQPLTLVGRIACLAMSLAKPKPREPLPVDVEIGEELDLAPYGVKGRVIHTPGHSAGSVCVVLASGEVVVGDLMMSFLRRGRPGLPLFAEDPEALRESIRKVMRLPPTRIYAAHGGAFDPRMVAFPFLGTS